MRSCGGFLDKAGALGTLLLAERDLAALVLAARDDPSPIPVALRDRESVRMFG
jgi:hypothetical protein